jgi:hypothetical protein
VHGIGCRRLDRGWASIGRFRKREFGNSVCAVLSRAVIGDDW